MEEINFLKEQIKDNIIKWYPFDVNINYKILDHFSKNDEKKLQEICNNMNKNQRIILLLENKLALKNVCQEDELYNDNKKKLYNKKEIEKLLDSYGLKFRKFYYVLPDIETANVIFTDEFLPTKESISRNIGLYNETTIKNDENKLFIDLIEQDNSLFKVFANCFIIECSCEPFDGNGIKFVSFSNMRKEEYRIQTIIKEDIVYKKAFNQIAEKHIENIKSNIDILNSLSIKTLDSYENNKIMSKYQENEKTLYLIINEKIKLKQEKEVIEILKQFFDFLKQKLAVTEKENNIFDRLNIEYKKENIENLTFVKYGFWDMIFQNVFYINNEFCVYDQEWIEEIMPLEFIIYRSYAYSEEIKEFLDEKNILTNFGLTKENIELFKRLDIKLQEKIRNDIFWKYHNNKVTIEELKIIKEKIEKDCIKLLNGKDARISLLEKNMEETIKLLQEKEKEIEVIKNSTSWKITKPLRKIRKGIRKENENKG